MASESMFQPDEVLHKRYKVKGLLGRGGMGEVYEAEDLRDDRPVALKTILPELMDSAKAASRFKREIKYSRAISHPNVLKIYDVFAVERTAIGSEGTLQQVPCMAMELLAGQSLADRFQERGPMGPDEAKNVVCQIAAALAAAHQAKIIHRDLKPDNIFLVPRRDGVRVVLTDFGVARLNKSAEEPLTASNVVVGTPIYLAPEQLELEKALPASDIYALGLISYELITGVFPFQHEIPIHAVFNRVKMDPAPPSKHLPGLAAHWEEVIMRCLARKPEDRFANAKEIIAQLEGKKAPAQRVRSERTDSSNEDAASLSPLALWIVGGLLITALAIFVITNT